MKLVKRILFIALFAIVLIINASHAMDLPQKTKEGESELKPDVNTDANTAEADLKKADSDAKAKAEADAKAKAKAEADAKAKAEADAKAKGEADAKAKAKAEADAKAKAETDANRNKVEKKSAEIAAKQKEEKARREKEANKPPIDIGVVGKCHVCSHYYGGLTDNATSHVCQAKLGGIHAIGTPTEQDTNGVSCYPCLNKVDDWRQCKPKEENGKMVRDTKNRVIYEEITHEVVDIKAVCEAIEKVDRDKVMPTEWGDLKDLIGWTRTDGELGCGWGSTYGNTEPNMKRVGTATAHPGTPDTSYDTDKTSIKSCCEFAMSFERGACLDKNEKLCAHQTTSTKCDNFKDSCKWAGHYCRPRYLTECSSLKTQGDCEDSDKRCTWDTKMKAARFQVDSRGCRVDHEKLLNGNLDNSSGKSLHHTQMCNNEKVAYVRNASGSADASPDSSPGTCAVQFGFTDMVEIPLGILSHPNEELPNHACSSRCQDEDEWVCTDPLVKNVQDCHGEWTDPTDKKKKYRKTYNPRDSWQNGICDGPTDDDPKNYKICAASFYGSEDDTYMNPDTPDHGHRCKKGQSCLSLCKSGWDNSSHCRYTIGYNSINTAEECCKACVMIQWVGSTTDEDGNPKNPTRQFPNGEPTYNIGGVKTENKHRKGRYVNPCVAWQVVNGKCRIVREYAVKGHCNDMDPESQSYAKCVGKFNVSASEEKNREWIPSTIGLSNTLENNLHVGKATIVDVVHERWAQKKCTSKTKCNYYSHLFYRCTETGSCKRIGDLGDTIETEASCTSGDNPGEWTLDERYRCPSYNECKKKPCMNGGICSDGDYNFTCTCQEGYEGKYCEINIDDCASKPCGDGGECIDAVNSYNCTCKKGRFGDTCQNKCPGFDSKNGTCNGHGDCDANGKCTCKVETGFTGNNCDIAPPEDKCTSTTCSGNGTCKDGLCDCFPDFKGASCDEDCKTYPCSTNCNKCGDHQSCNLETGKCNTEPCTDGFFGETCQCWKGGTENITSIKSGKETVCKCVESRTGTDCSKLVSSAPQGPDGECYIPIGKDCPATAASAYLPHVVVYSDVKKQEAVDEELRVSHHQKGQKMCKKSPYSKANCLLSENTTWIPIEVSEAQSNSVEIPPKDDYFVVTAIYIRKDTTNCDAIPQMKAFSGGSQIDCNDEDGKKYSCIRDNVRYACKSVPSDTSVHNISPCQEKGQIEMHCRVSNILEIDLNTRDAKSGRRHLQRHLQGDNPTKVHILVSSVGTGHDDIDFTNLHVKSYPMNEKTKKRLQGIVDSEKEKEKTETSNVKKVPNSDDQKGTNSDDKMRPESDDKNGPEPDDERIVKPDSGSGANGFDSIPGDKIFEASTSLTFSNAKYDPNEDYTKLDEYIMKAVAANRWTTKGITYSSGSIVARFTVKGTAKSNAEIPNASSIQTLFQKELKSLDAPSGYSTPAVKVETNIKMTDVQDVTMVSSAFALSISSNILIILMSFMCIILL